MPAVSTRDVERTYREEYGRAVAMLVRRFGDIDVAQDAVQDSFATDLERWPATVIPASPAGWIITTARNRAIDRLRPERSREERQAEAVPVHAPEAPAEEGSVPDERLSLVFTCCQPALSTAVRVALTLRLLGGTHHGGDRPCLPGAGAHDGAAARAGEGQDP